MWTPPERIRHRVEPTHWPSAEQAAASRLFSPIELGPTRLATRTWVPAMVPWRADDEGFVTPDVIDWYRRFAQGRPGALVVEATGVRDVPSGPLLRIGDDRFVPGLRGLVEAVREASEGETKLLIQCIDFLAVKRRPPADKFFARFLRLGPEHRERLQSDLGDDLSRVFEGGYTTGGYGLGLRICGDFVTHGYNLPSLRVALGEGYLGARLIRDTFVAWFHWPARRGA